MLKEKIEKYFNQYQHLRVLFFFDEKKEYLQEVEALEFENIKVEKWDNNNFTLKAKFQGEWKTEKVFLYFPHAHPRTQEELHNFPLLGLLIANKELALDDVGAFMEEFQLQRHQKGLVAKYMKELQHPTVQEVCKPLLNAGNFEETALVKGLVSAFLKFKQIESWPVLVGKMISLIIPDQLTELTRVEKKISETNIFDTVRKSIKEMTGSFIKNFTSDELTKVARIILYNKITQTITTVSPFDPYRDLKIKEFDQLTRINQMLQEIERNSRLYEKVQEAFVLVSKDIQGLTLIKTYGVDANYAYYTADMVWEIINRLQKNITLSPATVIKLLEEILLQTDLPLTIADSSRYLIQASKMHELINGISTYKLNRPDEYIINYTQTWQSIDTAYRKAIKSFRNLDISEIPETIDLNTINDQLNKSYEKHIEILNREWLKCLSELNFDYKKLSAPKQYDFYNTEVRTGNQKVVVIISDALRYEVATELLSELHTDPNNTADIRYQLASIPSKTSVGMAQLLPGTQFSFNDGNISVDGISTSGIENREKLLASVKKESLAVQFSDVNSLNQTDLREIFKKPVVYVYHDVIDSTGDTKSSERRTFTAVDEAIIELKAFVKKLHSSYNVSKVFITSDHGFLYYDKEIEEKDKENTVSKDAMITHNRYEIVKEQAHPEIGYEIPLSATTKFKDNLYVIIPQSVNRYKKQGVGHQFVHGGGSLQELIIPVIQSSRKDIAVAQKVKPILIQKSDLRIVSNILRVNILQEKKVSRFEKEANLSIGIYKDLQLVSKEVFIKLESTSDSPGERISRVELILSNEAANEAVLKLKVFYTEDKLNPVIEELVQNNTLIQADF